MDDCGRPVPAPAKPRVCAECRYWQKDYGMFCVNGWSGMDRDNGHCHVEPQRLPMAGQSIACRHGAPK